MSVAYLLTFPLRFEGFVDDDMTRQGGLIAGYSVLVSSKKLRDLMRQHEASN